VKKKHANTVKLVTAKVTMRQQYLWRDKKYLWCRYIRDKIQQNVSPIKGNLSLESGLFKPCHKYNYLLNRITDDLNPKSRTQNFGAIQFNAPRIHQLPSLLILTSSALTLSKG
jgi:hypothetical protein